MADVKKLIALFETKAKADVSGDELVFAPASANDMTLLAHELAHLVQQHGHKKDGEGAV